MTSTTKHTGRFQIVVSELLKTLQSSGGEEIFHRTQHPSPRCRVGDIPSTSAASVERVRLNESTSARPRRGGQTAHQPGRLAADNNGRRISTTGGLHASFVR